MSASRKRTLFFRKSIRDRGFGEYSTPPTSHIENLIRTFCTNHDISILELTIEDPFKDSSLVFRSTRKKRDELVAYLQELQRKFIITNVTLKKYFIY